MVRSPSLARPRPVGRQPQERSGPGSFASGMITHCQIMGQEPRIALTDSWLSLLFASAEIVLLCTT
jgi:hypothetical protein